MSNSEEDKPVPNTPVRLPDDLKRWLKHRAIDNAQTLSTEIVNRLQDSRARQMKSQGDPK